MIPPPPPPTPVRDPFKTPSPRPPSRGSEANRDVNSGPSQAAPGAPRRQNPSSLQHNNAVAGPSRLPQAPRNTTPTPPPRIRINSGEALGSPAVLNPQNVRRALPVVSRDLLVPPTSRTLQQAVDLSRQPRRGAGLSRLGRQAQTTIRERPRTRAPLSPTEALANTFSWLGTQPQNASQDDPRLRQGQPEAGPSRTPVSQQAPAPRTGDSLGLVPGAATHRSWAASAPNWAHGENPSDGLDSGSRSDAATSRPLAQPAPAWAHGQAPGAGLFGVPVAPPQQAVTTRPEQDPFSTPILGKRSASEEPEDIATKRYHGAGGPKGQTD